MSDTKVVPRVEVDREVRYRVGGSITVNATFIAADPFNPDNITSNERPLAFPQPTGPWDDDTLLGIIREQCPAAALVRWKKQD